MKIFFSSLILVALLPLYAAADDLPPELGFLAGCWRGEIGEDGSRIIEQYGNVDGDMLLGQLKTIRNRKTIFFEFIQILHADGKIWLQPFPNGKQAPVRFELTELEPDKASFENPKHDFPRHISYRLLPDGELLTRVAGVVGKRTIVEEYRTLPVECE